jgi:hypothetical protein
MNLLCSAKFTSSIPVEKKMERCLPKKIVIFVCPSFSTRDSRDHIVVGFTTT